MEHDRIKMRHQHKSVGVVPSSRITQCSNVSSMLFCRRNLLLAAMALSLVMAQDDDGGGAELKQCVGGEFEKSYFNFDIQIDHFSEDCEDFEKMGKTVQLVIEKVQMMIPEYEEEFIEATVCPFPTFVGEGRHLRARRVRRGTYSFAGAGGCKRCRANQTARRRGRHLAVEKQHEILHLFDEREEQEVWFGRGISASRELKQENEDDSESFEERVCETLVSSAVVDAAVAERAVEKAEETVNEMLAATMEKETKELLDGTTGREVYQRSQERP